MAPNLVPIRNEGAVLDPGGSRVAVGQLEVPLLVLLSHLICVHLWPFILCPSPARPGWAPGAAAALVYLSTLFKPPHRQGETIPSPPSALQRNCPLSP